MMLELPAENMYHYEREDGEHLLSASYMPNAYLHLTDIHTHTHVYFFFQQIVIR